jgi:pimeloyl-ACP methyl ester carboxylesterase
LLPFGWAYAEGIFDRNPLDGSTSFAQDLSEADRSLIVASQRPITLSRTPPRAPPQPGTLPSWAVVGAEDRVIPPDTQRHMAQRAGATITDVAGSHSMVSHPQVTIDAILAAVAAVGG